MSAFGYYPGCALHGSSNDYDKSVRACLDRMGVGLKELGDWICCGATAAHSLNHRLSLALPARNLGLAEKEGLNELFAPCPMCSMELIRTQRALEDDGELRKTISSIVEAEVAGTTEVLNLIQVFQRIGLDRLRAAVQRPLTGVVAACYYGCLLTRPPRVVRFDDAERPHSMEDILHALGASCVSWSCAVECCGAGMTIARTDTVLDLSHKILSNAAARGANCVVVACPMCHVNLDMKQEDIGHRYGVNHDIMIYYLSDLVGLALGLSEEELAVDKHFVVKDVLGPVSTEEVG